MIFGNTILITITNFELPLLRYFGTSKAAALLSTMLPLGHSYYHGPLSNNALRITTASPLSKVPARKTGSHLYKG
jgi:hypothetical protein